MQTTSMQKLKNDHNKKLKGGFNMFKTMNKRIKNEKGLTLIELLAVIVILAIVAAIAIPAIGNIIDNSRFSAVKSDAINSINAASIYFAENAAENTVAVNRLVNDGYLENAGKLSGTETIQKTTTTTDTGLAISGTTLAYKGTVGLVFNDATIKEINETDRDEAEATGATGAVVTGTAEESWTAYTTTP